MCKDYHVYMKLSIIFRALHKCGRALPMPPLPDVHSNPGCERALRPEGTRRAPHWGRSPPPAPLHLMLAARAMHRRMLLFCQNMLALLPDHICP